MREKSNEENVNYDYCEIETKNVELENSVAKLLLENERLCNEINHVKQVFKEQFDSIKKTRVRTKEQSDSLIDKLNLKSAENEDLKAQIQDKVFVITSLKNNLRKVKGKEIVDIAAQIPSANTIVPGMFKLDLEPLAPRLLQNREAHIDYLKYTQEQADILQEIVEQAKAKQPLDKELDFACKHAQRIQELLVYVRDTCPNAINLSAKKVAVTPKNKVKKVRIEVLYDTLGTTPEGGVLLGPERARTYDDLNDNEKKRFDADVRATNIVLQGLPKDIYKLINHNIEAKAIWDNVKMHLAGSELTKEDRESQLYDEFERFKMLPSKNINEYYVRFNKLVNDMRNIRMTMPNIQLNTKFVNNMSPEWDRFVTVVKLNKGLKETNHEQLYPYLKQHEKHTAQDRLIIERITPPTNYPLAFVSNVQPYSQPSQSQIVVQNVQGLQNQNQRYFARGNGAAGFGGTHSRDGNANASQGKPIKCYNYNGIGHIARNCTQPKRPQNSNYFKDKTLLMQAQENGAVLDEEELLFLVGEQPNAFDADVDNQPIRDLARNEDNIFQADECDAFDSDVDDEPTAQSIFMANLSSARTTNIQASSSDASILSEVPDLENANVASNNDQVEHEIHSEVQQSTVIDSNITDMGNSNVIPNEQYLTTNDVSVVPSCASSAPNTAYVVIDNNVHTSNEPLVTELAIYKEQVAIYEQRAKFKLTEREQRMDDQMRAQNPFYLRKAKVAQPTLYDGNEIINPDHDPTNVPSSEEDLELAELARQKMHEKMNDPVCVEKRINVETLRKIVEDAKVERPLDTSLASACRYTKHSQELLEYVIGFPAQSVGSSNTDVLDSPCLLVLITGMSQSRQHESCKSPTKSLFDVGIKQDFHLHCEYLRITRIVLSEMLKDNAYDLVTTCELYEVHTRDILTLWSY
ncbi:retrovirus-related pol polyprotein from transposon TNT 1-94 [Tanacetum coccineum]